MNKLIPVFVLLLQGPIGHFHTQGVYASMQAPISSPFIPISDPITVSPPGTQVDQAHHDHMDQNKKLLISLIVASSSLVAIILSLSCLWFCRRKKSLKKFQKSESSSGSLKGLSLSAYMGKYNSSKMSCNKKAATLMDYKVLEAATKHFQESNILGEGGFGCVYMARLDDNVHVAVKRLDGGTQDAIIEFETEVQLLNKIQHPNIITLLGYSVYSDSRLLVYELMHNGSLESQLHGTSQGSALTWEHRLKIALDIARGLEYLHEHCNPPVIHRDLKSSNILLDPNFNAKLSDFGLAVTTGSHNKNIKLSGTLGYVAPEYLLDGKLTDKSDVYAFGVVLLELLLGRKPVEKLAPAQCQSIVTWAMPQLTDRSKLPNIVDPVISNTMDLKHLYQVAAVAVLCVQPEPSYRPLITDVLHSLIPLVPVELGGTLRNTQPRSSVIVEM